jgi:hypothetical protein
MQSLLRELFDEYFTKKKEVKVAAFRQRLQLFVELVLSTGHKIAGNGKENQLINERLF